MNIFLDTNIFCADYKLNSSVLRIFFDELLKTGHTLCVLKIVIDEVINKFSEEVRNSKKEMISLFLA